MAFAPSSRTARAVLGAEIARLVQSHLKPKLIFSRALDVLVREKVEVPGYFPLAALILSAINQHNRRLTSTVEALLTPDIRALLDTLLRQESAEEEAAGNNAAYKLTLMKKLSQSKERVADLQWVEARYRLLKPVLDHLTLGQDGIQYYAYGVIKAQIFQLTRRAERERHLHLIAFIAHQYYRLHDNLVDVLLSSLQSFHNSALREHKDQCYVRREHRNESLKILVGFLDRGVLETLAQISALAKNSALTDSEKVQRICALLAGNQVTRSLDPQAARRTESDLDHGIERRRLLPHPIVQIRPHAESSQPDPQGREVSGRAEREGLAPRDGTFQAQGRGYRQDGACGFSNYQIEIFQRRVGSPFW
jgi:hypothetical protein